MSKLQHFTPASEEEIKKILKKSSSATCELDQMPTYLLKEHVDTLAPIITKMVNSSLETGAFPTAFKHAVISPLLKKENLDKDNKISPCVKFTFHIQGFRTSGFVQTEGSS